MIQRTSNVETGAVPGTEARAAGRKKRETWTFTPDRDVRSLVTKETNRRRRAMPPGKEVNRTDIINDALREFLEPLRGKREGAAS